CGGAIRYRRGTGRTARCSSPRARPRRSPRRGPITSLTAPCLGKPLTAWLGREATRRCSRATRTCSGTGSRPRRCRSPPWAFSTLGWPDDTPELKRYSPTDALVTGLDIIFFWVARMMMMGLYFMADVPFRTVYIHALVRDERGAKMSKSKGNVIDPLELIDDYGADALRFTLAAMAAQGRDIKLSTQRVEGYRNFATKLWNACRFAEINHCVAVPGFDPGSAKETLNRWIGHETGKAVREITEAIEVYKFNEAAGAAY